MAVTQVDSNRYIDLDAAVSELEPITVHLKGKNYEIPAQPPAVVMLKFLRWLAEDDGMLRNDRVEEFLIDIVGEDNYRAWIDDGLSYPQLEHLTQRLTVLYGIVDGPDSKDEGDSPNGSE